MAMMIMEKLTPQPPMNLYPKKPNETMEGFIEEILKATVLATEKLKEVEKDSKTKTKRVKSLQVNLDIAKSNNIVLQENLDKMANQNIELGHNNELLKETIQDLEVENVRITESAKLDRKHERDALEELMTKCNKYELENKELKIECNKYEVESEKLRVRCDRYELEKKELRTRCNNYKVENKELMAKCDKYELGNNELRNKCNTYEVENGRFRAKCNKYELENREKDKLIYTLQQALNESQKHELNKEKDELIETLQKTLKESQNEEVKLKCDLIGKDALFTKQQLTLDALNVENTRFKKMAKKYAKAVNTVSPQAVNNVRFVKKFPLLELRCNSLLEKVERMERERDMLARQIAGTKRPAPTQSSLPQMDRNAQLMQQFSPAARAAARQQIPISNRFQTVNTPMNISSPSPITQFDTRLTSLNEEQESKATQNGNRIIKKQKIEG